MKSNEEFIAGIYEKAAAYTEKEKESRKNDWKTGLLRTAAAVIVCAGLVGASAWTLGRNANVPEQTSEVTGEDSGIALLSVPNEPDGAVQHRIGSVTETVTFTGVVERIDTVEKRIWLKLVFEETAPESTENSIVCIKWDMLENISEEISVGAELTATGTLSQYRNSEAAYDGCAELVLTDMENLTIR